MKVLLEKGCHVEDRRAETSQNKPSLVISETCNDCKETFLYIIAEKDASNVTDVCKPCLAKWFILEVYCKGDGIGTVTVRTKAQAEKELQNFVGGTMAILWEPIEGGDESDIEEVWTCEDDKWSAE